MSTVVRTSRDPDSILSSPASRLLAVKFSIWNLPVPCNGSWTGSYMHRVHPVRSVQSAVPSVQLGRVVRVTVFLIIEQVVGSIPTGGSHSQVVVTGGSGIGRLRT